MREALTFLASRVFVESMLAIGVVALVLSRLRRRLRASPNQRSRAPVLWMVNLTADARLHRRLRKLAKRAREAARGGPRHHRRHGTSPSQRLALDLESEVVNLHERLISSHTLDYDAQNALVKEIRADADRIDALIDRTAALIEHEATDPTSSLTADPIGALAARLDQLEEASQAHAARVIDATAAAQAPAAIEATALDSHA